MHDGGGRTSGGMVGARQGEGDVGPILVRVLLPPLHFIRLDPHPGEDDPGRTSFSSPLLATMHLPPPPPLPSPQVTTMYHLDRPMYLLGYLATQNRVFLIDK